LPTFPRAGKLLLPTLTDVDTYAYIASGVIADGQALLPYRKVIHY